MCGAVVQNAIDLIKFNLRVTHHLICVHYTKTLNYFDSHSVSNPSITKTGSPEHLCSVMGSYPRVITELERGDEGFQTITSLVNTG